MSPTDLQRDPNARTPFFIAYTRGCGDGGLVLAVRRAGMVGLRSLATCGDGGLRSLRELSPPYGYGYGISSGVSDLPTSPG